MTDNRSKTSAINGKLGGRPKELQEFTGDLEGEVWKSIAGYDGYFISNMGRVLSCKQIPPMIRSQYVAKTGYPSITLANSAKDRRSEVVHSLVLTAFRGPRPEGNYDASHIDGTKTNNMLDNLIWESRKDNQLRRREHGTANNGERNGRSKLSKAEVNIIRHLYRSDPTANYSKLAKLFDITASNIQCIIKGKSWK
jgi:hypothetical protein